MMPTVRALFLTATLHAALACAPPDPTVEASASLSTGPDLFVRTVRMPPDNFGGPLDIEVEICNSGDPTSAFGVAAYLTDRPPATLGALALLAPFAVSYNGSITMNGHCRWFRLSGFSNLPSVEEQFLSVVADSNDSVLETEEGNNLLVAGSLVVNGIDPYVAAVSAVPQTSGDLAVEVKICGNGGAGLRTSALRFYLSEDDVLQDAVHFGATADKLLLEAQPSAGSQVGYGACEVVTQLVPGPLPAGAFFTFATIDEEERDYDSKRSNNQRQGPKLGIDTPDLAITRLTARGPAPYLYFAYEVCNKGTGPASSALLEFYSSRDATIDPKDDIVAKDAIRSLPALTCRSGTIAWPGARTGGRRFLGAILDPRRATLDADRSNNLASAGPSYAGSVVDLAVTKVWVDSAKAGSVVLKAEICNLGTQSSGNISLGFFLTPFTGRLPGAPLTSNVDFFVGNVVGAPLTAAACEVLTSGPSWVPTSLPAYPAASIYDPDLVVENNWGTGEQTLQVYNAELETTAVSYQGGVLSATICNRFPSATWWGGEIYESQDDVFDPLDGTFRDPITAYISASIPIPAFSCLNISEPYAVSQPWAMSRSVLNSE